MSKRSESWYSYPKFNILPIPKDIGWNRLFLNFFPTLRVYSGGGKVLCKDLSIYMLKNWRKIGFLALFLIGGNALAEDATPKKTLLSVGDPAPPLTVGKWIQGGPFDHLEKGKVYLVEFWATWCASCIQQIPHINETYKRLSPKGLNVMGISIAEEDQKLVPRFVKNMGEKMTYPVAIDDMSAGGDTGKMEAAWMDAAAATELPRAFIVNRDGLIAYLGSPSALTDEIIGSILNNKFDIKAARAEFIQRRDNKAKIKQLENDVETYAGAKDWAKAEGALDEIEKLTTADDLDSVALSRISLLLKKKDSAAAAKHAEALAAKSKDSIRVLDSLAWVISLELDPGANLMSIADKAIQRALELGKDKDSSVLETAARLQFLGGKKSLAIATQQKAVDVAEADKKTHLDKVLKSYKEGKLPEE